MIACHLSVRSSESVDFSFGPSKTQEAILGYVREWLPLFLIWSAKCHFPAVQEDDISGKLQRFFQSRAKITNLLFYFDRKMGSDFSVWVDDMDPNTSPVFLMEAKRLPPTKPKDYVHHSGRPGGISRFKLERAGFGDHLAHSAMLGYVQEQDFDHWFNEVNSWINDLIGSADASGLKWDTEDRLIETSHDASMAEYHSCHSRIKKDPIHLTHFWLNVAKLGYSP